jgi:signal transduction histidine kinase
MKLRSITAEFSNRAVLAAAAVLAAGIFALDVLTDVAVVVADLYVVVVLMVSRVGRPRDIWVATAACGVLAVVGHFICPGDGWSVTALVNLSFILATIGVTAFIVWRHRLAERALGGSRDQLAHLMRVTTLGELTASLTHEVNQPLAGVVANAHAGLRWLAVQPPDLSEARNALDRILRDGHRAGTVTERVRAMARKFPPQMNLIDINDAVQEVVVLTRGEAASHRTGLATKLSGELPAVPCDRVQVQQVIFNLVTNALEAAGTGGTGPRQVQVETAREGAGEVRVTVRDSGLGLGPQELEKVFHAFYTTKPHGMGMGLAISRSIVQAHGGRLWATPNAPRGAAFHFSLPIEQETIPALEQSPSASPAVDPAVTARSVP